MNTKFLSLPLVLQLHDKQLVRFGGASGIRDEGMLESAIAQPKATFEGQFLHPTVFDQAAAYLFHICQNHPFIDGNKRTALSACLVFLGMNGYKITTPTNNLYDLTIQIAEGKLDKDAIVEELRLLIK